MPMLDIETIANRIYNDPRAAAETAARLATVAECAQQLSAAKWWQFQKRARLHNQMAREGRAISRHLRNLEGQHRPEKPHEHQKAS